MAGISKRPHLKLSAEEIEHLRSLGDSQTAPWRESQRARILLRYHSGENVTQVAKAVGMTRQSVDKWITKALAMGARAALKDAYHRPKEPVISEEAKAWVVHLACSKPKEFGYAAEVWTRSALARHVREHAPQAGYASLAYAAKATVHRILIQQPLHPEKRPVMGTVSVDEKPGLQAIANTAPDLPPVPGTHSSLGRDHEYKRLGTCSILAALDLHHGHVTARVERRHRSREFIALLKDLDTSYPAESVLRLIMDNHSAHLSKETKAFLASRPNRFQYVLTPKHGSWLNLVETLFGKMARTFLRHIRVKSWEELRTRILRGIAEINAAPVVHRWKKFEALSTG